MPRAARIAPKEHIYHILTRGNNRQDIFKEEVEVTTLQKRSGGGMREEE